MFVEFMKEDIIKSAKLDSLSPPFLPASKGGLAPCDWDNGVISSHSARPAAIRAIFTRSPSPPCPQPVHLPRRPQGRPPPILRFPPLPPASLRPHCLCPASTPKMTPSSAFRNWAGTSLLENAQTTQHFQGIEGKDLDICKLVYFTIAKM